MPQEERIERWQVMMDRITRESLTWWRESFIDTLCSVSSDNDLPAQTVSGAP